MDDAAEDCGAGNAGGNQPPWHSVGSLVRGQRRADATEVRHILAADGATCQMFLDRFPFLSAEDPIGIGGERRLDVRMFGREDAAERFGRPPQVVAFIGWHSYPCS